MCTLTIDYLNDHSRACSTGMLRIVIKYLLAKLKLPVVGRIILK
jgi:hypothetical protein